MNNLIELNKVAEISAGGGAPQEESAFCESDFGMPVIRAGSLPKLLNGESEKSLEHLSEETAKQYRLRLFPKNTIVFAKSGMSATKGHIYQLKQSSYVVNHLAAIVANEQELYAPFLKYWFQVNPPSRLIKDEAYPSIRLSEISEIKIPKISVSEQKRIAAVIDQAALVREKRRQSIEKLDQLLQSVFLDMFGDPVSNPKGWEVKTTGELLEFLTSGSRGWAQHYADKGSLFLRIQNVKNNRLLLDDIAYVEAPDTAEARRTKVKSGDVLISITADLGRCATIPRGLGDAFINQHLALLRLKNIEPEFYSAFVSSEGGQRQIGNLNREGVKAGLNFDNIRALKVFVPPVNLQRKYIESTSKIESIKNNLTQTIKQSENLFQSLQQRAFAGELFGEN